MHEAYRICSQADLSEVQSPAPSFTMVLDKCLSYLVSLTLTALLWERLEHSLESS